MEDDKLKQILQNIRIPEASLDKKKLCLDNALNAFDKNSSKATQGNQLMLRLMDITNKIWSISMNTKYYKYAATTAVALIVGVYALNNEDLKKGLDVPQSTEQQIATPTEADKKVVAEKTKTPSVAIPEPVAKPQSPIIAYKDESKVISDEAVEGELAEIAPPPPMVSNAAPARQDMLMGGMPSLKKERIAIEQAPADFYQPQQYKDGDKFEEVKENAVRLVSEEPVSTFSIDVDTSSYSFIRSQLNFGRLPDPDSVRVEEMVNYFDYNYALPEDKSTPFKPTVNVIESPWKKGNQLVHIGIKGYDIKPSTKPHSNLVFLIDTSGSMAEPNKLPLLINSFGLLVDNLDKDDTVSIVTYAGSAGTVLEPTKATNKQKILNALGNLYAGGSTAGAEGIKQAYALAESNFDKEGVNRVILATDGDFNVGISDPEELKEYISDKRKTGVYLSVLGFGQGNYNDELMQKLAQNGNGNAAYIDSINEARKVLVEEASSTLFPIAKDVKIQVEFNPEKVSEYRLVGYETRMLNREDFNNDKVDAGEIGSGHAVTAIYEITPKGEKGLIDESRYSQPNPNEDKKVLNELGFLKIRYKLPNESKSKLMTTPIKAEAEKIAETSTDAKFAVAVAAFGQVLKGETYTGDFSFEDIIKLAESAKGEDKFGYRAEFINLVRTAKVAKATGGNSGGNEPIVLE